MHRYLVFSAVGLSLLLTSMATFSVAVALPIIITELDTSLIQAGWVLAVYGLVQTIVMALAGKVNEALGRRTTFIAHIVLFSVGSMLCSLAPNVYVLIGARVVQAVGGGGFMPAAAEIVTTEFPRVRQRVVGLLSSILPIGMIVGPNVGGWMAETFGWRSIFWFNVPLGLVVLALALLYLQGGKAKEAHAGVDVVGAGLLSGSLFAFMFGLTSLGNTQSGMPWVAVGALVALGSFLLVCFVRRENRSKNPLIDMELLTKGPFLAANAYNLIYCIGGIGIRALIPLFAVSVYGMSTLESGIMLTPWSLGMTLTSTITSFYIVKWGYRRPILLGTSIMAVGFVLLALEPRGVQIMGLSVGVTPLLLAVVGLCGVGHGICTPASNNACIELMPNKIATIFGLRGVFRQLGGAIGVSAATVVLHAVGDMHRAFQIVMMATAITTVISIPIVFAMPACPESTVPPVEHS